MFFAKNQQKVGIAYGDPYLLGTEKTAIKLTITVHEGPVVLQTTEEEQQFFPSPIDTEALLDIGFHSLTFAKGITAWKFRAWEDKSVVDFRAYGVD